MARDGGADRGDHFAVYWEDCEVMVEIYYYAGRVPIIHRYAMGHRDTEAAFHAREFGTQFWGAFARPPLSSEMAATSILPYDGHPLP